MKHLVTFFELQFLLFIFLNGKLFQYHKFCINQYNKKYSQAYHLLKLLFKLLLADMRVIDGVGFDEREVMAVNSPL